MQYIHLPDKYSFKKFTPHVKNGLIIALGVVSLSYVGYSGIKALSFIELINQDKKLTSEIQTLSQELENKKQSVMIDNYYPEFNLNSEVIKDVVSEYYPNVWIYEYLFKRPPEIRFQLVEVNAEKITLQGQSLTYKDLLIYINILKDSNLFSSVNLINTVHIPIENNVSFKMELVKPEIKINKDNLVNINLDYIENLMNTQVSDIEQTSTTVTGTEELEQNVTTEETIQNTQPNTTDTVIEDHNAPTITVDGLN